MAGKRKDPIRETALTLAILCFCLTLIGLLFPVQLWDVIAPDSWEEREIEFASIEYAEKEELSDRLPGILGQIVEFLRWDDEQNDGTYVLTDAQGIQWIIHSTTLEYGMDTALLYETVEPGDALTIWQDGEYIEAMSMGDVVFLSYEQAWREDRVNSLGLTASFGVCLVLALWSGHCLLRLRREGERYWKTLPKWLRESD